MGKKKNKKNKYYTELGYGSKKKESKKSKKKDVYYEAPKLKSVKPSLEKKDIKEQRKIILAPVEIPKEFKKNRCKCNHAGDLMTVAEFKAMTPSYGAYTPMLDTAIQLFGEDNLAICASCYDVLINPGKVGTVELQQAIAMMYLTANVVLSRYRLKDDEIKKISKLREELCDWDQVKARLERLEDKGALEPYDGDPNSTEKVDMAEISRRGVI